MTSNRHSNVDAGGVRRRGEPVLLLHSALETGHVHASRGEVVMEAKRFFAGTIVGGITVCVTGYLLFSLPPISAFYLQTLKSADAGAVAREGPLLWAVGAGALSYGALVTWAIGGRRTPADIGTGIRTGAIAGVLLWLTANLMLFGISTIGTFTTAIAASLLEVIPGAIAGGAIAIMQRSSLARAGGAAAQVSASSS
jgi:hypothetical protein